jgi:hypothetical protein
MRIAMPDTYEYGLEHDALKPSTPGAMQWTDELPTMPGWYWLQRAVLRHNKAAWYEVYPVLVDITQNTNGTVVLYMPGLDHVWTIDDVVVGEWAGPLHPPAECRKE